MSADIVLRDVERGEPGGAVLLQATVVLPGGVVVRFVRLREDARGTRVTMPARLISGAYVDVVTLPEGIRARVHEALEDAFASAPAPRPRP